MLLIQVSRLIRETVSANDRVIRYSGDEFIIFGPGSAGDQAPRERIQQVTAAIDGKVEETHFPGAECFPNQKLTLAYGAALFPEEASTYDDLIAAADHHLYQNKHKRDLA